MNNEVYHHHHEKNWSSEIDLVVLSDRSQIRTPRILYNVCLPVDMDEQAQRQYLSILSLSVLLSSLHTGADSTHTAPRQWHQWKLPAPSCLSSPLPSLGGRACIPGHLLPTSLTTQKDKHNPDHTHAHFPHYHTHVLHISYYLCHAHIAT